MQREMNGVLTVGEGGGVQQRPQRDRVARVIAHGGPAAAGGVEVERVQEISVLVELCACSLGLVLPGCGPAQMHVVLEVQRCGAVEAGEVAEGERGEGGGL